jgi:hypothetical protein
MLLNIRNKLFANFALPQLVMNPTNVNLQGKLRFECFLALITSQNIGSVHALYVKIQVNGAKAFEIALCASHFFHFCNVKMLFLVVFLLLLFRMKKSCAPSVLAANCDLRVIFGHVMIILFSQMPTVNALFFLLYVAFVD